MRSTGLGPKQDETDNNEESIRRAVRRIAPVLTLVLALAFGLVLVCCAGSEADAGTATDDFCRRLDSLSAEGRHSELVAEAVPAYAAVRESGDAAARLRIGCRIGRAYYYLFDPDSMYRYFDDATAGADSSGMSHERIMMLNTMGVFNMVNAINYSQALDYFYQAMNLASESGDRGDYYRSLTNVTIIHYYRRDPEGLETARAIYDYGRENGDAAREYTGALMLAYMYHTLGNDLEALKYVDIALEHPEYATGTGSPEPLHACVLASLGRDGEAEEIFRRCIGDPATENTILLEALSEYGRFLAARGRLQDAVRCFLRGLDITEEYHLYFYGHAIYRDLADVYSRLGRYDRAVNYLNEYQRITDDVFNVERERSFNALLRNFDRQTARVKLQQKDMQIMRQKQGIGLIAGALLVVLVLAAAIYTNYRLRDRMYRRLVIKYNDMLRREQALQEAGRKEADAEDGKLRELFGELDRMMTQERLYERKNLTIEEAARLLGTNRGYLSRAVNSFAGVSFNAYVNSFRIKAAVSALSDRADTTPIKVLADRLGYNTSRRSTTISSRRPACRPRNSGRRSAGSAPMRRTWPECARPRFQNRENVRIL